MSDSMTAALAALAGPPRDMASVVDIPAILYPHKVAMQIEGAAYTFDDLYSRIIRTSRMLESIGIKRGDRVSIALHSCIELVEYFFASIRLGAVFVPLRVSLLPEDWIDFFEETEVSCFLVQSEFLADLRRVLEGSSQKHATVLHVTRRNQPIATTREAARIASEWSNCRNYRQLVDECESPISEAAFASRARPDDLLYVISTSGTTGKPKGIATSHKSVMTYYPAELYNEVFDILKPGVRAGAGSSAGKADFVTVCDRVTKARQCFTTFYERHPDAPKPPMNFFDKPLCPRPLSGMPLQALMNAVAFACEFHLFPVFDVPKLLVALQDFGCTMLWMTSTQMAVLFEAPEIASVTPGSFPSLQLVLYSGTHCSETVQQRAIEFFKCAMVNVYGMSETAGAGTALIPPDHVHHSKATPLQMKRMRSAGRPQAGVRILIANEKLELLPPNTEGEVLIGGPKCMEEYYRRPEKTKETIVTFPVTDADGVTSDMRFVRSGDVGYVDDGGYLFLVGRNKDVINLGGTPFGAAEVENALMAHPDVSAVAVVPVMEMAGRDACVAWLMLKPGTARDLTHGDVVGFLSKRLAGLKHPKHVYITDELPTNDEGKMVKAPLAKRTKQLWEAGVMNGRVSLTGPVVRSKL